MSKNCKKAGRSNKTRSIAEANTQRKKAGRIKKSLEKRIKAQRKRDEREAEKIRSDMEIFGCVLDKDHDKIVSRPKRIKKDNPNIPDWKKFLKTIKVK